MTDNQKAAYVMGESVAALIEALGMMSENLQRMQRGESLAYNDEAFTKLLNEHCICHNSTLAIFHN